jgi:hypothetical protein
MSIPGIQTPNDVPPPLPPPRYFPGADQPAPPEDMGIKREYTTHGSFASGYGSMTSSYHDEHPNYQRRDIGRDEGYASYSSTDRYGICDATSGWPCQWAPRNSSVDSLFRDLD